MDFAFGRYREALAKLGRVLDQVPEFPGARRKLAAADRACRLDAQYHQAIGHALAGRWYEALVAFRSVERAEGTFPVTVHWVRVCRSELRHERAIEARQPAIPLNPGTLMVSLSAAGSSLLMMCAGAWLTMNVLMGPTPEQDTVFISAPSHTISPGEFTAVAVIPFATPSPTASEESKVPAGAAPEPAPGAANTVAAPAPPPVGAPAVSTPATRVTTIARRATSTATRVPTRTPTRAPVTRAATATPPPDSGPTVAPTQAIVAPAATVAPPTVAPAATSTPAAAPTATPPSAIIVSMPTATPVQPTSTPTARPTATPAPVNVVVQASEYSFNPASLQLTAGARVHLTLVNSGSTTLDWVLLDSHGIALVKVMAGAGQVVSRDFTAPPAGTYNFVCDVADYAVRGMKGTAYVSPR